MDRQKRLTHKGIRRFFVQVSVRLRWTVSTGGDRHPFEDLGACHPRKVALLFLYKLIYYSVW
jgi:hypothetical protein